MKKYKVIHEEIRKLIEIGELNSYTGLPSLEKTAEAFQVSKTTVVYAYELLEEQQLIIKKNHRYVVNDNIPNLSKPITPWYNFLKKTHYDTTVHNLFKPTLLDSLKPEIPLIHDSFGFVKLYKDTFDKIDLNNDIDIEKLIEKYLSTIGISLDNNSLFITSSERSSLKVLLYAFNENTSIVAGLPNRLRFNKLPFIKKMNTVNVNCDKDGIIPDELYNKVKNNCNQVLYLESLSSYPLGISMPQQRRDTILSICEQHNIPIIEVDYKREQYPNDNPLLPLKSTHNNIIYLSSLIVDFSPCDYIAFMVVPKDIEHHFYHLPKHNDVVSNITKLILSELFDSNQYYDFLSSFRKALSNRYKQIDILLDKYLSNFANWDIPQSGIIMLISFNDSIVLSKMNLHHDLCRVVNASILGKNYSNSILLWITSADIETLELFIKNIYNEIQKQLA